MASRIYSVDEVGVAAVAGGAGDLPAISMSASGLVPTSGWTRPEFGPWMYITPPADGILDLDFMATAPTGIVLQVFSKICLCATFPVPQWVVGVRVHTSTNIVEARIAGKAHPFEARMLADGLPVPWPFPWWAPKSKRQ